jgi:transcriptional regulator with XRE-family HTH domain
MDGRALVAWNLRRIRVARGLSQERLAFDAGVDRSYVGGLERSEENPTVDLLGRLAKILQVSLSELRGVRPGLNRDPDGLPRRFLLRAAQLLNSFLWASQAEKLRSREPWRSPDRALSAQLA